MSGTAASDFTARGITTGHGCVLVILFLLSSYISLFAAEIKIAFDCRMVFAPVAHSICPIVRQSETTTSDLTAFPLITATLGWTRCCTMIGCSNDYKYHIDLVSPSSSTSFVVFVIENEDRWEWMVTEGE
jgi:hypothetical protein